MLGIPRAKERGRRLGSIPFPGHIHSKVLSYTLCLTNFLDIWKYQSLIATPELHQRLRDVVRVILGEKFGMSMSADHIRG